MAEGVHIAFGGKRQAILGVDASRFEKFLPQGASEFFHIAIKRQLGFLQQNMARQRVTVGVQAAGGHSDHHVAGTHTIRPQNILSFHNAHGGGRDVVMLGLHHAWMFRGFTTKKRATRLYAALGDASDNVGDMFGHNFADRNVVLQKQGFGTADHKVINAHGHQVDADGVVLVHGLGDGEFGSHAVGTRR